MSTLVVDIESVGENFDQMDEMTKENLTRNLKRITSSPEEYAAGLEEFKKEMGLSPLTGEACAIGMYDAETLQGIVYYTSKDKQIAPFEEDGIRFINVTEKEMLQQFWEKVKLYSEVVTFNGWGFDIPFLYTRSAIHRIKPSRNLMYNRFLNNQRTGIKHIDLQDQLSYYAAVKRKGSLHMWCRAFGIATPKIAGHSGDDVSRMYADGLYEEIARYNARDIVATKQLYDYWNTYLRFE